MRQLNKLILLAVSVFSGMCVSAADASTRDDIVRLQQGGAASGTAGETPPAPLKVARMMTLSNGARVNLNDWTVVLFMQGHCPYCQKFDPLIRRMAAQQGFPLFVYTFDGQGDEAFPEAIPAPPEVMKTFFAGLPVASPTTFLVNVHTLKTWPLVQGATDETGFMARLDTVFQQATAQGG